MRRMLLFVSAPLLVWICWTAYVPMPDPIDTSIEHGQRSEPARSGARLRVATFNMQKQHTSAITRTLASNPRLRASDVLLLQEIERRDLGVESEAGRLAAALGYHHVCAPAFARRRGGDHGLAILSRYPLERSEVIELRRFDYSGRRIALATTCEWDRTASACSMCT